MEWTPQTETLSQLAHFLRDSLSAHDKSAQKQAELALKSAKSNPEINSYLVYLCTQPSNIPGLDATGQHAARSAAAIMLKNNVKIGYKSLPDQSKAYIRSTILTGLQDPNAQIRSYAGNVITEVVRQGGILGWPQVLSELMSLIENSSGNISSEAQDGAMGALLKICEDNKSALNKQYDGQRPLDVLIPKLLAFTGSSNSKVRSKALGTLNSFIDDPMPQAVQDNAEKLMLQLFQLAGDQNEEVRRFVCRSFTKLTGFFPDMVAPHLSGIIDYILLQQKADPNSELALDAAEFFFENCEVDELQDGFAENLDKIIPVLLESMIYGEDDQARLEGEAEDDAEREDQEQDIKPQFATSKLAGATGTTALNSGDSNGAKSNGYAYEDDDLSEGEVDEDDYGDDPEDLWNLRRCSAASLDTFATRFHERVFESTLPYLKDNLNHRDWPNREAAVLALGAISEGCMDVVQPNLPDLIPFLISLLSDQVPVVRQITCWALGRYSAWAAQLEPAGKKQFFEPMMKGILQRMLDNNKRVQEAAASAFANLEEKATNKLVDYALDIVPFFVECFGKYKDKNMFILYDCVQTLAEHVGPVMAQPEMVNQIMPALIERWQRVSDQSREMFPLLECLAYIATALGPSFAQFAQPFWDRCIRIIQDNLEEGNAATGNPGFDTPDKDFLVTSLDLLSAIIQALNEGHSGELVSLAQPNFFHLLAYCMRDPNNDVKQSAYALLGDCAIYVFAQLQPYLDSLMQILTQQLDLNNAIEDTDTAFRVINNACWSVGEIAMRQQSGMAPYIDPLLKRLASILFSSDVPESLNENAAIAIGRLGVANHEKLAPHLAEFATPFLSVIRRVGWTDEKCHAYRGFASVVLDNPQALEQCLLPFLSEIATAPIVLIAEDKDGPFEGFKSAIAQYKNMIPDFNAFLSHLPAEQAQVLKTTYGA